MNLTRDSGLTHANERFVGQSEQSTNENTQESLSESVSDIEMQEAEFQTDFVNILNAAREIGPIGSAIIADEWKYRGGTFIDYYNKKQLLIKLAYIRIDEETVVQKIIIGFPSYIRDQIMFFRPQSEAQLRNALETLDN